MWGEMCCNMPWYTSHCQRCPLLGRSAQAWFPWPVCSWFHIRWPQGWRVVLPEEKCWGPLQTETQREKWSQNTSLFRDYGQYVMTFWKLHKSGPSHKRSPTSSSVQVWSGRFLDWGSTAVDLLKSCSNQNLANKTSNLYQLEWIEVD